MKKMHTLFSSLRSRGVLETFILSFWLLWVKINSIIKITIFNGRGYDIAASVIFFGKVWLYRTKKQSIHIGHDTSFGNNLRISTFGDGEVVIGNNVLVTDNCMIHAGNSVKIGSNTLIGANCYINDTTHNFSKTSKLINTQGTRSIRINIEDDVWIGVNVTLLPGVTLGKGSIIGAGAVVTKDVEPYSVVAGVPAKLLYRRK